MKQRLAAIARELGFAQVSVSHEVAPLIKLVGRGDTTVVDAYLSPILRRYVDQVAAGLGEGARLQFMQSNGGLTDARAFRGKDAILSGPAGGVVGMVAASAPHGRPSRLIGFDMGGTSTDVSHYAGRYELGDENIVAGVRIRAPMMQIHTIAAGGGSICRFDGMRFRVGPESAGARPGPGLLPRRRAADGHRLQPVPRPDQPGAFPRRVRPGRRPAARSRGLASAAAGSRRRARRRQEPRGDRRGLPRTSRSTIWPPRSARSRSPAGHDVTRYTLACFGGAGGQHACRVADALGMERILIHPLAGVLSAYGIGLADVKAIREASWLKPLERGFFGGRAARWRQRARSDLIDQGFDAEPDPLRTPRPAAHAGSDTTLEVELGTADAMRAAFDALHRKRFGYVDEAEPIVDTLTVEAIAHPSPRPSRR